MVAGEDRLEEQVDLDLEPLFFGHGYSGGHRESQIRRRESSISTSSGFEM